MHAWHGSGVGMCKVYSTTEDGYIYINNNYI